MESHSIPFATSSVGSTQISHSVSVDWYSGPVEGYIQCPITYRCFKFKMLKAIDSSDIYARSYRLKEIPTSLFFEILAFLSSFETPDFPIWFFELDAIRRNEIGLEEKQKEWDGNIFQKENFYILDWDLDNNVVLDCELDEEAPLARI